MNVWNVRSAMSANKSFFFGFAIVTALFSPTQSYAQASAPGMYGVSEIIIEYPRFENPKAADACGLNREDISALLSKTLTSEKIPAIPVSMAKPPMMGVARIQLIPEISTVNTETLDCTSWVSLIAQSQSNLVVPPITTPRNVTIVYWHKGSILATAQSIHNTSVAGVIGKMAGDFAQQYSVDQPPKLPQ